MEYNITDYSYKQADKLGVYIHPSINKKKKIDVFKDGIKVCSIGASGYLDYPHYLILFGKAYADERRRLYRIRHQYDRNRFGTAGFYSDRILW